MAFATKEDVIARLEGEVTDQMASMIEAALEDATDLAIYYGRAWTATDCPDPVRRLVARAVARWMRNPDGFSQSRAADETLSWERPSQDVEFTAEEIERIRRLARATVTPTFVSAEVSVRGLWRKPGEDVGYVPVQYGGDDFPFLVDNRVPAFVGGRRR